MMNNYLYGQIKEFFPYEPTAEQEKTLKLLANYILSQKNDEIFLLRGYAGTGKTSLIAAMVKAMVKLEQKCVLLAPTGRAAKVFSEYADHKAFTIHKKIYRQKNFSNGTDNYELEENLMKHTLFVVDEASMIANDGLSGAMFGTGRLLDDLTEYVYSGEGCKLVLMGDSAQLPPVGEELSPALFEEALAGYGLNVIACELTEVVRQEKESGILWNATQLRCLIAEDDCWQLPKIRLTGFHDVQLMPGNELIEAMEQCYSEDGEEETIVISRSNKRAIIYNRGIRNQILWREEELSSGDLIMVAKNNYFWTAKEKELDFLANGEIMRVRRVRNVIEMYGFRFADATITFLDNPDYELEVKVLLDTLHSEAPALTREESDRLFNSVWEDYPEIGSRRERMKRLKEDPYYNALQIKYAYAVTCHKAQGGQWKNVFIDQGYMTEDFLTPDYFKWLYTAFTRATRRLYLVNYPKEQLE